MLTVPTFETIDMNNHVETVDDTIIIDEGNSSEEDEMKEFPLLKYARLMGSLPRGKTSESAETSECKSHGPKSVNSDLTLSVPCKCTKMGRVAVKPVLSTNKILNESNSKDSANFMEYSIVGGTATGVGGVSSIYNSSSPVSTLPQVYYLLALGMSDGTLHLVHPESGAAICPGGRLNITSTHTSQLMSNNTAGKKCIIDLSFDASGAYLAAINQGGDVSIFELRYGQSNTRSSSRLDNVPSNLPETLPLPPVALSGSNIFESFLSKLAGDDRGGGPSVDAHRTQSSDVSTSMSSQLIVHAVSTARFHYHKPLSGQSPSPPTCLAIDPSYRRRREKAIVVGFEDGRLLLTKRSSHGGVLESILPGYSNINMTNSTNALGGAMGLFLQPRRHDIEIYQGIPKVGRSGGIEALTWRGSLISWADSSGIKIFDSETMSRIAHIDRPTGARVDLYPTISSLRPSLVFERCDSLLIAWGDCLMSMQIKDEIKVNTSDSNVTGSDTASKTVCYKVECNMAWQLDCVACDVVPLDINHVVVLGLVPVTPPIADNTSTDDRFLDIPFVHHNLVEIQIINRSTRNMISCDALPIIRDVARSGDVDTKSGFDDANDISLVTSFCVPRQEDSVEAEEEACITADGKDFDVVPFHLSSGPLPRGDETSNGCLSRNVFVDPHGRWNIGFVRRLDHFDDDSRCLIDEGSVGDFSDDSDDYNFLFRDQINTEDSNMSHMKVDPPVMVIKTRGDLVTVRTRDIDDAIFYARSKGLHGQALRRGLIYRKYLRHHSLRALVDDFLSALLCTSGHGSTERETFTAIRRLRIAAQSCAMLIGGDVDLWIRWTMQFSKVEGGLFLLRPFLPVRDPKLPKLLFEFVLNRMYIEIAVLIRKGDAAQMESSSNLCPMAENVTDIYINTLFAWGPTSSLEKRIHLLSISASSSEVLSQLRKDLEDRFCQSASGFLQHQVGGAVSGVLNQDGGAPNLIPPQFTVSVSHDSLFSISNIEAQLARSLNDESMEVHDESFNNLFRFHLQILSALALMKGAYADSLKFILLVNSYTATSVASIQEEAIRAVNSANFECKISSQVRFHSVIALIETHQLQKRLLDPNFLCEGAEGINRPVLVKNPVVAFITLLGLHHSGEFFVDHCTKSFSDDSLTGLPIEAIASQLKSYSKLLYWFLNLMLLRKPDLYVVPTTAVPSLSMAELYTIHFDLLVEFANRAEYEARNLWDIPKYNGFDQETPLLTFLKKTLSHSGLGAEIITKKLTRERMGSAEDQLSDRREPQYPHLFARELAYVIERTDSLTEEVAMSVLTLYLEGATSLPLAVEFALRCSSYSALLWEHLVSFCLGSKGKRSDSQVNEQVPADGVLFGSLLEVAAIYGADLAFLISQIPDGLQVEGIRPKLVAAVADYRMKVKIHEIVRELGESDKVRLLQDLYHIWKRAKRVPYIPGALTDCVSKNDYSPSSNRRRGNPSVLQIR